MGCKRKKRVMGDNKISAMNEGKMEKLVTEVSKIRAVTGWGGVRSFFWVVVRLRLL